MGEELGIGEVEQTAGIVCHSILDAREVGDLVIGGLVALEIGRRLQ